MPTDFPIATVTQYGFLGVMLLWFMFRMEKKLDVHTSVINDLAKAISLDVLSRPNTHETVQRAARGIVERTEARQIRAHPPKAGEEGLVQ